MAAEMVVLSVSTPNRVGGRTASVGLYVPVTKIAAAGVPSAFNTLPAVVQTAWTADTAKQTALDAGDAIFVTVTQNIPQGMTLGEAQAAAQGMYPGAVAEEQTKYTQQWQFVGLTIDAV